MEYNASTPLYTSDKAPFRITDVPAALDKLFSAGAPVLLFVHGRGFEPKKSLEGGFFVEGNAVHKLERDYGVRVLMFNWDSAPSKILFVPLWKDRSRPLSKMPGAAESLHKVLTAVAAYRSHKHGDKRLVLLAHSMGTIVLETLVRNHQWPVGPGPIFSNVVLTGADANNETHESWLTTIAQREKVYVTVNRDDDVLADSTDQRPEGMLPLGVNPGKQLAANVRYVEVTGLGTAKSGDGKATGRHEMFTKAGMHQQVNVCRFFNSALRGNPVELVPGGNVETVVREQILQLKFHRDPKDACWGVPTS
ncbi:MAG TPA: alpha/beta hydrolase [Candidatus Binatia bacterium]|jgi:hypothetical protein